MHCRYITSAVFTVTVVRKSTIRTMLALVVLALHILDGFAAPSQLVLNSLIQDVGIKVGLSSESTKVAKPLTGNIVYELHETERKFLLNVPDNYVHGETHPLVFSFHGGKSSLSTTHYLKRELCKLWGLADHMTIHSWRLQ